MRKKTAVNKTFDNILLALEETHSKSGYIPEASITKLARSLGVPVSDVYGVASFYSFLYTKPPGRNVIRVCKSLPCHIKEGQTIIDAIKKKIGIEPGRTTSDGCFTFELANCIGLCDGAPAMLINNDVYVDLTPGKIAGILDKYK